MRPEYIVGGIIAVLVIAGLSALFFFSLSPISEIRAPEFAQNAGEPYKEIASPSGFVNTDGIMLKELIGKKVILVDFLTYSCINCQRTFPYLVAWYEKYKDQGLEIVGIHTPEFAFEKDIDNVREAMKGFGITYPIVLDNDYATWQAYGNQYWPRKYLIDIHGNIVYDHIGEGGYEETEMKIRELLMERARVLGDRMPAIDEKLAASLMPLGENAAQSPETYFGSFRNEYLANGTPGRGGDQVFSLPQTFARDALYLGGTWAITPEYAEARTAPSVVYRYDAKEVYIVADADDPVEVEVLQDGKPVGVSGGDDVRADGVVSMKESRLYKLIRNAKAGEHILELRIKGRGLRLYAFTFG